MSKKSLSERDICTKFITPALVKAGWDVQTQIYEEVSLTKGRVIVSGRTVRRGESIVNCLPWSDHEIPSFEGWRAIRDKDMEAYIKHDHAYSAGFDAPEGSPEREASDVGGRETLRMRTMLYECPQCGRVMW